MEEAEGGLRKVFQQGSLEAAAGGRSQMQAERGRRKLQEAEDGN